MFDDFARIASLLTDEKKCLTYLKRLNDALIQQAKNANIFNEMTKGSGLFGFGERNKLASPKNLGKAPAQFKGSVGNIEGVTLKRHKQHKVLSGFLTMYEAKRGFNKGSYSFDIKGKDVKAPENETATLPGFLFPQDFRQHLLARARHFKDPTVSTLHGEFTHRLQWYLVCEYMDEEKNFKHSPAELFQACANPVWCFKGNPDSAGGIWDLVFEGNPNSLDLRKPESFTEYLLLASETTHKYHGDLWFIAEMTMGRYAKRNWEKSTKAG
jgi:hypothetical protein